MKKRLILASSSPRRIELLNKLQMEFEVFEPEVKEDPVAADPHTYALTMARLKARWVAERVDSGVVLGADTVVTIDGTTLGKPGSEEEERGVGGFLPCSSPIALAIALAGFVLVRKRHRL